MPICLRTTLFVLFLLLNQAANLHAQNELRHRYYYNDSCPDPLANLIATRKIYEVFCDTNDRGKYSDTITEYYNSAGLLVELTQKWPSWERSTMYWHHFYYDKKGRIICDSTFNEDGLRAPITYEHTKNKSVRHWPGPRHYGDEYVTTVEIYDDNRKLLEEYRINEKGDTMHEFHDCGNSSFEIWRTYNDSDEIVLSSTTTRGYDSTSTWDHCHLFRSEYGFSMGTVRTYNDSGLITELYGFDDDALDYFVNYYYDNNRLIYQLSTWWNDEDTNFRNVMYKYNERGLLIESREWDDDPDMFLIHEYKYNEHGLREEENVYWLRIDGSIYSIISCEKWEYTYYDVAHSKKKSR